MSCVEVLSHNLLVRIWEGGTNNLVVVQSKWNQGSQRHNQALKLILEGKALVRLLMLL